MVIQDTLSLAAEDIIGLKIQAYGNNPDRAFQDKADIQSLIRKVDNLDFERIQMYAELFDQWPVIQALRGKK